MPLPLGEACRDDTYISRELQILRLFGQRHKLFLITCVVWTSIFVHKVRQSNTSEVHPEYGLVQRLSPFSTHWPSPYQCGLDGRNCRPFNNKDIIFRCPAGTGNPTITDPVFVGDTLVNHCPLVIGGPEIYRGDSFICAASEHAGVLQRGKGGCAILQRRGPSVHFQSVLQNGIRSIGFDSDFPFTFSFKSAGNFSKKTVCQDPRNELLIYSGIASFVLAWVASSDQAFFGAVFTMLFFHVAFVSDSPDEPEFSDFNNVVSVAFGRFLPAAFGAYCLNHFVHKTLTGFAQTHQRVRQYKSILLTVFPSVVPLYRTIINLQGSFPSPVDRAHYVGRVRLGRFIWLFMTWIGALMNVTFAMIPVPRLTWVDLVEQPHAMPAFVLLVVTIIILAVFQARDHINRGIHEPYFRFYMLVVLVLILLCMVPGQTVRPHHYIWPLPLIPGTTLPTIKSLLFQGLLVGLFINGTARWGFASISETPASLFPNRSPGSYIPHLLPPAINDSTITFAWSETPPGVDGVQLIANNVLIFQGFKDHTRSNTFEWTYEFSNLSQALYLVACGLMEDHFRGITPGTCSHPGKLTAEGVWFAPDMALNMR